MHSVCTTPGWHFMIPEENRLRFEKQITGLVNKYLSKQIEEIKG